MYSHTSWLLALAENVVPSTTNPCGSDVVHRLCCINSSQRWESRSKAAPRITIVITPAEQFNLTTTPSVRTFYTFPKDDRSRQLIQTSRSPNYLSSQSPNNTLNTVPDPFVYWGTKGLYTFSNYHGDTLADIWAATFMLSCLADLFNAVTEQNWYTTLSNPVMPLAHQY